MSPTPRSKMRLEVRMQALVAMVVIVSAALAACSRAAPEEALRAAIKDMAAGIERREPAGLTRYLAADFVGTQGLDRDGAVRLAQLVFLRHRQVGVALGPMDIEMQGRHATVRTSAIVAGGGQGLLPEMARAYRLVAGWRLEEDRWRLTSLDWTAEPP